MKEPRILIIEDDTAVSDSLRHLLESLHHKVETASTVESAVQLVGTGQFDVVVTDLNLTGPAATENRSGLELVRHLHKHNPRLPVILMTGNHTTEIAIEATKQGAFDYIPKPVDPQDFLDMIEKAVASSRLMTEPVALGSSASTSLAIVGQSRLMQTVYKEIGRVAAKPVTVLIRGETGTGKELVARAIYQHSDRADKPFIIVNCVAIPENLLESELFGHERGAFTGAEQRRIGRFEQAHQGTIFLDEIGDMSMATQAKILRVLQEKTLQRLGGRETITVNVRIIAATHRDLETAMREHRFREDLYYRLNVATIHMPPLRDRSEDIPALITYFIQRHAQEMGIAAPSITPEAIALLQSQPWPGNARELENVVRKSLLASRGFTITNETIQDCLAPISFSAPESRRTFPEFIRSLLQRAARGEMDNVQSEVIQAVERELYSQAIQLAGGNQAKAAKWLGISRPTMRDKLQHYGIHPRPDSPTPHG
jgi:DNA-binding NtrC family response regulator